MRRIRTTYEYYCLTLIYLISLFISVQIFFSYYISIKCVHVIWYWYEHNSIQKWQQTEWELIWHMKFNMHVYKCAMYIHLMAVSWNRSELAWHYLVYVLVFLYFRMKSICVHTNRRGKKEAEYTNRSDFVEKANTHALVHKPDWNVRLPSMEGMSLLCEANAIFFSSSFLIQIFITRRSAHCGTFARLAEKARVPVRWVAVLFISVDCSRDIPFIRHSRIGNLYWK